MILDEYGTSSARIPIPTVTQLTNITNKTHETTGRDYCGSQLLGNNNYWIIIISCFKLVVLSFTDSVSINQTSKFNM